MDHAGRRHAEVREARDQLYEAGLEPLVLDGVERLFARTARHLEAARAQGGVEVEDSSPRGWRGWSSWPASTEGPAHRIPAATRGRATKTHEEDNETHQDAYRRRAPGACAAASAADLGKGPITIISPFPPGGGTDTLTRMIGSAIAEETGWNIVVENKPGAGGNLALDATARAQPDGHTLVMAQTDNIVLNPGSTTSSADTFKDFKPVGRSRPRLACSWCCPSRPTNRSPTWSRPPRPSPTSSRWACPAWAARATSPATCAPPPASS